LLKSTETLAVVVPLKSPRAIALGMNEPEGLVVPWPWIPVPPSPIVAEREVTL
jgi:hypothetical protein